MMDDYTRFSACLLGLMNVDLETRGDDETRASCVAIRDKLRCGLSDRGLECDSQSGRLAVEDYKDLKAQVQDGGLEETLALLVELCAAEPWAQAKDHPRLDPRARERYLGRLSIDLPGESDEDDVEHIDGNLKEGRELAGWSTARWAVVIGGGAIAVIATGGAAGFLLIGPTIIIAGGAAAAIAAAAGAEVAVAIAGTVLGGAGAVFGATVLSSDMSPEAVDVAVVKRFALVRMLRSYPRLKPAASSRLNELIGTLDELKAKRASMPGGDERKALDQKIQSFQRAIQRLVEK